MQTSFTLAQLLDPQVAWYVAGESAHHERDAEPVGEPLTLGVQQLVHDELVGAGCQILRRHLDDATPLGYRNRGTDHSIALPDAYAGLRRPGVDGPLTLQFESRAGGDDLARDDCDNDGVHTAMRRT